MKIAFNEITLSGIHKHIEIPENGLGTGTVFSKKPVSDMTLVLLDDGSASLTGKLCTTLDMRCSRCGESVLFDLDVNYDYIFKLGEDTSLLEQDIECSDEDCHTVYLNEPVINIESIMQEQLILSTPGKIVCGEDCKGLCPKCGTLLSNDVCNCNTENQDSPFAVLKSLKTQQ